jgi:hypothetical protein
VDRTDGNCPNAKFDIVADDRNSTVLVSIANCYAVAQGAISSDDDIGMDKYVTKMIDSQSGPYLRVKWKTNSSYSFHNSEHHPVNTQLHTSDQPVLSSYHPSPKTIYPDCPNRLLSKKSTGWVPP